MGLDLQTDTTFTGVGGGKVELAQGAEVYCVNGKMKDQGHVLTSSGTVTAGATDATPSATGLTAGDYVWDGSYFTKGGATPIITIGAQPAATTTVTYGSITGSLTVIASATQGAGVDYRWYSNTTNSNIGGTLIPGANFGAFAIPTTMNAGTYYYFCEVSATGAASVRSTVATVIVNGNPGDPETVIYPGAALQSHVQAGASGYFDALAPSDGANGNTVTVNDTTGANPGNVFGGYNTTGASTENSVTLNSGATVINNVFGGFATSGGNATGNTVILQPGATAHIVYGGWVKGAGSASGNTVVIHTGAVVNYDVFGGVLASSVGVTADNNTVVLHPGVTTNYSVWGGSRFGAASAGTGNKLELKGAGQSIGSHLKGFQIFDFSLPAGIANGGTVVTVGNEADISGAAVRIGGSGLSFSVGDTVTLIDASATGTLTGTPANSTATGGGYSWSLLVSGGKLIATVTSVSSGGGGGGSSATPTIPAGDGGVKVDYTQSGGDVTLTLSDSKINEIITTAKDDTASFDLSGVKNTTIATLPTQALDKLADAGLAIEIKLPQGTLILNTAAVTSVAAQANGASLAIELTQAKTSDLSPAQRDAIKTDDVVLDINITSGGKNISSFDGEMTVTVPYSGPLPVAVWYLNDEGELEKLACTYDPTTKTVSFALSHLSLYVLGADTDATAWENPFADVHENDWFYGAVQFVHENGLFSGTSDTTFSPNVTMTRGMMATVLWRMAGSPEADSMIAPHMMDVEQGAWYEDAFAWAAENGIIRGYGEGMYGPMDDITREQMAVILNNYAMHIDEELPQTRVGEFADNAQISAWAKEAVAAMYGAEILNGKGENAFAPQGEASRAEVSAMLMRFSENVGP